MSYSSVRLVVFSLCIIFVFSLPLGGHTCLSAHHETRPIVLITGFEPFGSYEVNPSQLIALALNGQDLDDAHVYGVVLPVEFNRSTEITTHLIDSLHPTLVICIGLEAKTRVIHVENLGINLKRDPYSNGSDRRLHRIIQNGPFLHVSPFPTRTIIHNLRKADIPARQSWCAGTYACNALLYQVLHHIHTHHYNTDVGFLHVPLLSSQDQDKGMDFNTLLNATQIVIKTSLNQRQ